MATPICLGFRALKGSVLPIVGRKLTCYIEDVSTLGPLAQNPLNQYHLTQQLKYLASGDFCCDYCL